jgi:hypothetical protein
MRGIDHLSNLLGVIGIILLVILMMGVNSYALLIAAFVVELIGFTWSRRLDYDPITTRGFALGIIFWLFVAIWGLSLALQAS